MNFIRPEDKTWFWSISHVIWVFVRISPSRSFFEAFSFLFVEYIFANDYNLFFWQRLLFIRLLFLQYVLSIEWLFKRKLGYFFIYFEFILTNFTFVHRVLLLYKLKRCLLRIFWFAAWTLLRALTRWVVTAGL